MDSPKEVSCKENIEVSSQKLSSIEAQEMIKEKKTKEPEPKMKPTPTVLELSATGPHTRLSKMLRLKFKLMGNPELKDIIINVDEEMIDKKEGKQSANSKKESTKRKMRVSKVDGLRVSKVEGLKMLAVVLDTLH